jgi:hypothetical protein
MSKEAEEFYRRENRKVQAERDKKTLESAGFLLGLAAGGVSKIFGHFSAKKEEKHLQMLSEVSEKLAGELGVEDTGNLSRGFERALVSTSAAILTLLAKKTNRINGETPRGFITTFCFFGLNYVGSEPYGQLGPMLLQSFARTKDESPVTEKQREYWNDLEGVAKKEFLELSSNEKSPSMSEIIKRKVSEHKDWSGNENLAHGILYAAASYLVYPKGELSQKGTEMLEELFPLLGVDEDGVQEVVNHAIENFDAFSEDLENYRATSLFA